jgi:hypothetical protein
MSPFSVGWREANHISHGDRFAPGNSIFDGIVDTFVAVTVSETCNLCGQKMAKRPRSFVSADPVFYKICDECAEYAARSYDEERTLEREDHDLFDLEGWRCSPVA